MPACLAVAVFAWAPVTPAATFPDLFTVTVRLDPDVRDRRAAATSGAMAVLLTRITGRRQAGEFPELEPLLDDAARLVTSYAELADDRVRVGFNASAVQARLTALGWPIWGAERPQIVLWAAVDFGAGLRALLRAPGDGPAPPDPSLTIALDEFRASILEELVDAADRRGLPMALPLLDEQDFELMSFAGVWGGFDPLILQASARYAADFALAARISVTDFGLEIDWSLIGADGTGQRLRTSTVADGIDWVADQFAVQFTSSGDLRLTRIEVEGVRTLADYGRIINYLETVSIIESVDVTQFHDDVLTLSAAIRADDTVLERVFELGGVLQRPELLPGGIPGRYRIATGSRAGQ